MSWKDRYIQNLRITTGDAEVFELFTRPSFTKQVDYDATEFNFVGIEGKLVKKNRENLNGRSFQLEFYFIGENCLEDAKSFEFSARHPDPWVIEHPYYDTILAQVLSLKFDDTELNVTKVTCTAIETITDSGSRVVRSDPRDIVLLKKVELDDLLADSAEDINPTIQEIDTVLETTEDNYSTGVKIISIPEEAEEYFNAFNEAISYVNTFTASPILAIQALTNVLTLPSQFLTNVKDRVRTLGNQIDRLRQTISGLVNPSSKKLYLNQHMSLLSAICKAAVTPSTGDYTRASAALAIVTTIRARYAQFLEDVDTLQSINGGSPLYFVAEFNAMNELTDLVTITASSLFEIALAGRKEVSHTLTEDSNVILLTHRFYKLDSLDANIQEFIDTNGLTHKEIALGLPKGKQVVYYITP